MFKKELDEDFLKGLAGLAAYTNAASVHPEKDKNQGKVIDLTQELKEDSKTEPQELFNTRTN